MLWRISWSTTGQIHENWRQYVNSIQLQCYIRNKKWVNLEMRRRTKACRKLKLLSGLYYLPQGNETTLISSMLIRKDRTLGPDISLKNWKNCIFHSIGKIWAKWNCLDIWKWLLIAETFMSRWIQQSETWSRVPSRFGGMQNLALSPWYFRFELKSEARSGNCKCQLERNFKSHGVFIGLGCEIRNGRDIRVFQFMITHLTINRPTQKPQAGIKRVRNEPFVRVAMSGFR